MTAKQKANQDRFKKVVAEAKKLRAKNKKLTQPQAVKQAWAILYSKEGKTKKVGAVKIIQKGEDKKAKVTKTLMQIRTKKGLFKRYKKVSGTKTHKDTKSHNVNIRVVSGIENKRYNVFAFIQKMNGLHERLAFFYFDKLTDAKKSFNELLKKLKENKEKGIYTIEILDVKTLKQKKVLSWIKL